MKSEIKWPNGQITFCDSECNLDVRFNEEEFKQYIYDLAKDLESEDPLQTIKFKKVG